MQPTLDVVIVGAGLSGLQAATDVQDAGLSYTILEARDRIGGKTLSFIRNDGKGIQEAGAAWINDSNQDRVWKLVQKFGLHTITQPADGKVGFEDSTGLCHSFAYGEMPHVSVFPTNPEGILIFHSSQRAIATTLSRSVILSKSPATTQRPLKAPSVLTSIPSLSKTSSDLMVQKGVLFRPRPSGATECWGLHLAKSRHCASSRSVEAD